MNRRASSEIPLIQKILTAILVCLFFLYPRTVLGNFKHINLTDGLSQSQIFTIAQDRTGYMWFGTLDGLNKFNGYDFKIFKRQPGLSNTLTDNNILSLCPGDGDILWIGTDGGGLVKFNTITESFTHYKHDPQKPNTMSNNFIRIVYRDPEGILWIGANDNILNRMDPRTNTITHFPLDIPSRRHPARDKDTNITSICRETVGLLWIGTNHGLWSFNTATEDFTRFSNVPENNDILTDNRITSLLYDSNQVLWVGTLNGLNRKLKDANRFQQIVLPASQRPGGNIIDIRVIFEDSNKRIWFGTYGNGLFRYDPRKQEYEHFLQDPADPRSISDNYIISIFEDRSGVIWIGTDNLGLNIVRNSLKPFHHIWRHRYNANSLSNNQIWAIEEDMTGNLWVGTNRGLNRVDSKRKNYTHYFYQKNNPRTIGHNIVRALLADRTNHLWIGTDGGGLDRLNIRTGRFTHYTHDPANPRSISSNRIRILYEDRRGTIWIGTLNQGLDSWIPRTGQFMNLKHDPDNPASLCNNSVFSIMEDSGGHLWVGTFEGISVLDKQKKEFTHYEHDNTDPTSLSDNGINCIFEDRKKNIWIATDRGLNQFNKKDGTFSLYTEKDGLPNDFIYAILQDSDGYLWISTNRGISRFDPAAKTFRNYDIYDGLQGNEFNYGAYHQSQRGEIFLGGTNGLNYFIPHRIKDNKFIPPIVITDFRKFNQSVHYEKVFSEIDRIRLSHKDKYFSIHFAALDFTAPEKNQYKYRMEGFEEEWHHIKNNRVATYTNLDPGTYTFHVQGSNNDGIWNTTGAKLNIIVPPPFSKTIWFYLLLIITASSLVIGYFRFRVKQLEKRKEELVELVEKRTSQLTEAYNQVEETNRKLEKINAELDHANRELKDFAYVVSHDLKAPLRAVNRLASWLHEDHAHKLDESGQESLVMLQNRVKRMDNLINGVLTYSRIGRSEGEKQQLDLNKIVEYVVENLSIPDHISITIEKPLPTVFCNQTQIEQIFQNLISNGVKYNDSDEGWIKIDHVDEKSQWVFSVSDNGPGIDPKYHKKVFRMFQTLHTKDEKESTGVGLTVTKKIVEFQGGRIWIESIPDQGCTFYFTIPKKRKKHSHR